MQTKKLPQKETQTTQTVQQTVTQPNKKVITVVTRDRRGRSPSKDKTTIREELKKLLLESVFEIPDATSCKPIQAYISAYSTSRAQGLITLLCSTTSGYNLIANVAFVAKRQDTEKTEFVIEKTWIKNAMRLYVPIELSSSEGGLKIIFADELSPN